MFLIICKWFGPIWVIGLHFVAFWKKSSENAEFLAVQKSQNLVISQKLPMFRRLQFENYETYNNDQGTYQFLIYKALIWAPVEHLRPKNLRAMNDWKWWTDLFLAIFYIYFHAIETSLISRLCRELEIPLLISFFKIEFFSNLL